MDFMERQISSLSQNTQNDPLDSLKSKRAASFEDCEVHDLLDLWSSEAVQQKFKTCKRHALVYEFMAQEHKKLGYDRLAKEIKNKINNLKTTYRSLIPKSGGAPPTWIFYNKIHHVLGQNDSFNPELLDDSLNMSQQSDYEEDGEQSCDRSSERSSENSYVENSYGSNVADDMVHGTLPKRIPMSLSSRPPRKVQSDEKILIEALLESNRQLDVRSKILDEKENRAEQREIQIQSQLLNFMQLGSLYLQHRLNVEGCAESAINNARPAFNSSSSQLGFAARAGTSSSSHFPVSSTPNPSTPRRAGYTQSLSNNYRNQDDNDEYDIQNMGIVMDHRVNSNILGDLTSKRNVSNERNRNGNLSNVDNDNGFDIGNKKITPSISRKFKPKVKSNILLKRSCTENLENNNSMPKKTKTSIDKESEIVRECQVFEDLQASSQQLEVLRSNENSRKSVLEDHMQYSSGTEQFRSLRRSPSLEKSVYDRQLQPSQGNGNFQHSVIEPTFHYHQSNSYNDYHRENKSNNENSVVEQPTEDAEPKLNNEYSVVEQPTEDAEPKLNNENSVVEQPTEDAEPIAQVPFDALLDESFSDID